jgi:DNA-binding beta-propeller fold protein YncE
LAVVAGAGTGAKIKPGAVSAPTVCLIFTFAACLGRRRDHAGDMISRSGCLAFVVAGLSLCTSADAESRALTILPGLQHDGSVLLPNQWSLRPAGRQVVVGDFPANLALHPGGRYAAVLHCGYSQHEIRILDLVSGQQVSQVALNESFYGLAWSPDGRHLYASGATFETVHAFAFADGLLADAVDFRLRPEQETGVPIGLATDAGGGLYVAEGWGSRVDKLDAATGKPIWTVTLTTMAPKSDTDAEGPRWAPTDAPDAPFPYACLPDPARGRLYVSLWGRATVLVLDAKNGTEVARWPVGSHPNEMVLSGDGRLFVAEANTNTVSVLDVASGRVLETLSTSLVPEAPPGSMPNSLALSPDGHQLFVANADNNNLAAFDVTKPGRARSLGFIPVGWFPTSVRVGADGRTLVVANGKGVTSAANPAGPFPGDPRPRNLQDYIAGLFKGTVSLIALPDDTASAATFGAWTKQVLANRPAPPVTPPAESAIPNVLGGTSPIKHVIYIVKENRTYDQILGDLPEGNGSPQLCLFPEAVTPNQHALAREFVLLDNFYVDGEVSADGHEWTMGAYATDFVEKTWPLNYGHNQRKKINYPGEAAFALSVPERGYLWDQAARAGVSYRSYGEFVFNGRNPTDPARPARPVLREHIDPLYRGFDLGYPDVRRAARFIEELQRFEAAGDMPRLQVVRLGNDHTVGSRAGALSPRALVADNDLALGRLVEAVSHSKFWADTAIFVLEDDAQNGPDHVDAHRSPCLVISPYTLHHAVDSTLYSTTSVLRTIELILGLQPMSQFDAAAAPMNTAFTAKSDLTPFAARPAQVDLEERNPPSAWGAKASARMDFREADRADDIALNEIIWRSVKGAGSPMPAPVRAAFFKSHPKSARDDD